MWCVFPISYTFSKQVPLKLKEEHYYCCSTTYSVSSFIYIQWFLLIWHSLLYALTVISFLSIRYIQITVVEMFSKIRLSSSTCRKIFPDSFKKRKLFELIPATHDINQIEYILYVGRVLLPTYSFFYLFSSWSINIHSRFISLWKEERNYHVDTDYLFIPSTFLISTTSLS